MSAANRAVLARAVGEIPESFARKTSAATRDVARPRVLFVANDFPPHRFAGASLYAMRLAQQLESSSLASADTRSALALDGANHASRV